MGPGLMALVSELDHTVLIPAARYFPQATLSLLEKYQE